MIFKLLYPFSQRVIRHTCFNVTKITLTILYDVSVVCNITESMKSLFYKSCPHNRKPTIVCNISVVCNIPKFAIVIMC